MISIKIHLYLIVLPTETKQEAHGPHRSPDNRSNQKTNLHKAMIIPKRWLREKKIIIFFLRIEWSLYNYKNLQLRSFTQGCFAPKVEIDPSGSGREDF